MYQLISLVPSPTEECGEPMKKAANRFGGDGLVDYIFIVMIQISINRYLCIVCRLEVCVYVHRR